MEMTGERLIAAPRKIVWDALNNPEVLKACIPGCETLEATSPEEMTATVAIKLGPLAAKFAGRVKLSDIDPPNGYTLSGEGKGGPAGFAKGAAKVNLSDEPEGTKLSYAVEAQVGGRIAQLGARLIDTTAKALADQFFAKFAEQVQELAPSAEPASAVPVAAAAPPAEIIKRDTLIWILIVGASALALAAWLLL